MGYCSMCWIHWDAESIREKLAIIAPVLPLQQYAINGIVRCLVGSLDPRPVHRNRRRAALYVLLVSFGPMREFIKPESWDRSDHGPYRRDLVDKIISFLA